MASQKWRKQTKIQNKTGIINKIHNLGETIGKDNLLITYSNLPCAWKVFTAPSLTNSFLKSRTSSGVDEWSGLDAARCTPSYPWGGFGPLLPWDLVSCCFLEQKERQIPISVTRGNCSWPHHWFWWIYSISMAPWMNLILFASKPLYLLTLVGDDTTNGQPKRASWNDSTAPPWLSGHFMLSKHWRAKPKERDKLLDVITVDPSPSSLRTLLMHSHIPHSVQSRVVQSRTT